MATYSVPGQPKLQENLFQNRVVEMTLQIKSLSITCSIPRTHMKERNSFHKVSSDLHVLSDTYTHTHEIMSGWGDRLVGKRV